MPSLSKARRGVLECLTEQSGPVPLATLVALTGLHENTLRGHLSGLAEDGLVSRERDDPQGRGRPAWLWRVRHNEVDEYAGLASTLARTLRRTSEQPLEDATEAGQIWGRDLAMRHVSRHEAVSAVVRTRDLLARLGFAPTGPAREDTADLRLTRCPLLEAAVEEPEIVCNVHRGLAVGALGEYGADDAEVDLVPFAEPGACRLKIAQSLKRT